VSAVATRPRLGFLGVGWIGRLRLEAVAASGEADVAAVADPAVPGALASLDELLAEELDGVVIATPSRHSPRWNAVCPCSARSRSRSTRRPPRA
jgi:hypothetical protein